MSFYSLRYQDFKHYTQFVIPSFSAFWYNSDFVSILCQLEAFQNMLNRAHFWVAMFACHFKSRFERSCCSASSHSATQGIRFIFHTDIRVIRQITSNRNKFCGQQDLKYCVLKTAHNPKQREFTATRLPDITKIASRRVLLRRPWAQKYSHSKALNFYEIENFFHNNTRTWCKNHILFQGHVTTVLTVCSGLKRH